MKSYDDIVEQKRSAIYDEHGVFFAFSQQQFDKARKLGVKYVRTGYGMFLPKDNAREILKELEDLHEWGVKEDIRINGIRAVIVRELYNHECFYVGSSADCLDKLTALGYPVTKDQVRKVFIEERPIAHANLD